MNFIVNQKTIEQTECDFNFNCLYGDKSMLCKVEVHIGERYFMNCPHQERCRHQIAGTGYNQCGCPVRKEIYINYGV